MNVPNTLTITRIFLVPLLLVVLLTGTFPNREVWGLVVFLAAALTDYFDGYLARKRLEVTTLGKLLDPIADKLLISAAFIALVELGRVPAWMVVIVVGREFAVTGLRSIAAAEGFTISASRLGKYKMVSQVACVTCLIGAGLYPTSFLNPAAVGLLWLVVILAIASMIQYFYRFWSRIDESVKYSHRKGERHLASMLRKRRKSSNALINP